MNNKNFSEVVRHLVRSHKDGLTPQEIRSIIKRDYPHFYGTESHIKNTDNKHYQDLDHALLAQIYSLARTDKSYQIHRDQKPYRLTIGNSAEETTSLVKKTTPLMPRKRATKIALPCPTQELVMKYLNDWQGLESYRHQEDALAHLFCQLCPQNKKMKDVLLKVSCLNDFYSTHIFNTFSVSKHILQLDIDSRLANKDLSLVNDIACVKINGKSKNLYSFATKFCSHHNPCVYPIFDSYVEKVLCQYRNQDGFFDFQNTDLRSFPCFVKTIEAFRGFYGLEKFSLKELDVFMWLMGKALFPKKYYA